MVLSVTAILNPTTVSDDFWSAAHPADGSPGICFDRCVDWLLGMSESTTDPHLRLLVADVLNDLRALGPVEGVFEEVVVDALASVEAAFDIRSNAIARS